MDDGLATPEGNTGKAGLPELSDEKGPLLPLDIAADMTSFSDSQANKTSALSVELSASYSGILLKDGGFFQVCGFLSKGLEKIKIFSGDYNLLLPPQKGSSLHRPTYKTLPVDQAAHVLQNVFKGETDDFFKGRLKRYARFLETATLADRLIVQEAYFSIYNDDTPQHVVRFLSWAQGADISKSRQGSGLSGRPPYWVYAIQNPSVPSGYDIFDYWPIDIVSLDGVYLILSKTYFEYEKFLRDGYEHLPPEIEAQYRRWDNPYIYVMSAYHGNKKPPHDYVSYSTKCLIQEGSIKVQEDKK